MSFPWTPQQVALYDRLEFTNDSIIVRAVAGSGKTTSLGECSHKIDNTLVAAALAFNVRSKKDLERIFNEKVQCLTINGLGHRAMCKYLGTRRPEIDGNKMYKITREVINEYDAQELWSPVHSLATKAKTHGLVPSKASGQFKALMDDSYESWDELATHYDIDFSREICELAREVLIKSIVWSFQNKKCDWDDQVYIPTCWPASFDQRDVLFVDEAQDLSAIQHKMLKKALRRGGRMIAVGDENQAIYGFRGSLSNSISLLKEAFNLQPMGLTTSFRCAKSIVREAQKIVPDIEAFNGAPEGSVEHVDEFDHSIFKHGDVILCRNNGPLIKMAYRLIMEGVGVHVLGRDIGSGLVNLVKRLMGEEFYGSIEELHQKLDNWEEIEVRRATGKEEWSKVASLNDKADSLRSVIEFSGAESLKALCQSIKDLFGRTSAPILLSSIHKAKGSEWDRVYFLDSDLIPSRWAIKANDRNPELFSWMMEQEQNLRYVGVTRAKSELVYINGNGWSRE